MTKEELDIDNKRLDFNEKVQFVVKKEELKEQDIRLNKLCFDYQEKEKRIEELENQIADIKANCDLAIEGRDVKIQELEKRNAELKKEVLDIRQHLDLTEREWGKDTTKLIHFKTQLTKAKEIIKTFLQLRNGKVLDCCKDKECPCENPLCETINEQAEQFLKEIEK